MSTARATPWWRHPLVAVAAGTVAVIVLMSVTGMNPNVGLMAAIGGLLGCAVWLVTEVATAAPSTDGVVNPLAPAASARADRRVMHLRSGIAYGRSTDASVERLATALVELIDDQLLAAHQIDRSVDPEAAAAVLGPELTAFVEQPEPDRRLTDPRRLDRLLTRIERL